MEERWRSGRWGSETTTFDSTDFRNTVPRFTPENRKTNQAVVDLVRKVAERKKATPACKGRGTPTALRGGSIAESYRPSGPEISSRKSG